MGYNLPHMVRMYYIQQATGFIDNANPRKQMESLKDNDTIFRCQAAHQNGLESFPLFAAGILAALKAGVDKKVMGQVAFFHLVTRVVYNVAYTQFEGQPAGVIRTTSWFLGALASCQLLSLAAAKCH